MEHAIYDIRAKVPKKKIVARSIEATATHKKHIKCLLPSPLFVAFVSEALQDYGLWLEPEFAAQPEIPDSRNLLGVERSME